MKHRVVQVGLGVRGKFHLRGLVKNPEAYEIVGLCDLDPKKIEEAKAMFGLDVPAFTDAETMLRQTRPEVFVFVTHPNVRTQMVELAVRYGVKVLSFEKPMAMNLGEAHHITQLCRDNHIKAVVSHQQKYAEQMQKVNALVRDGQIGEIQKIHVETQSWLAQLGTHYMDYSLWMSGGQARVRSVVGHAHGTWCLGDSHPSPDYLLGEALLTNGVRVYLECGYFSQRRPYVPRYGYDNRLTAYGTNGYLWFETDGKWGGVTKESKGELIGGTCPIWDEQEPFLQIPYYRDLARWIDDDTQVHPCNIEISYHGYEALEAMCLSALDHTRVDLPLKNLDYEPVLERMGREFSDVDSPRRRTWIEIMD